MPPTTQFNVRIRPEHREVLAAVASRLKTDPGFAVALAAFLSDAPVTSPVGAGVPPSVVDEIKRQLDAVNERVASMAHRLAALEKAPQRQHAIGSASKRDSGQLDIEDLCGIRPPADTAPKPALPDLPTFNAALAATMEAEGLKAAAVAQRMADRGHGVSAEAVRLWLKGGGITHERRAVLAEIFPALKEIEQ